MKFLEKMFGEVEITWKLLIIYSVVTGAVVGLLNCVPALEGTSFVAPAETYEYWFPAALFVIMNCKSAKEAMVKTFVFFLISQPLVYLVEVPFKAAGWGLFYYYMHWILPTILTIPGAWIAYQVKRDNILSAVILSVASGELLFTAVLTGLNLRTTFPKGLVTVVFCLFFAFAFIFMFLKKKKTRIAALLCTLVIAGAAVVFSFNVSSTRSVGTAVDETHQWEIVEADEGIDVELSDTILSVTADKNGTYHLTLKNENGDTVVYEAVFEEDTMSLSEVDNE